MRELDHLKSCIERPQPRGEWVARFQRCCVSFSDALRSRLEGAERGLYRELPTVKPRLAGRIDALLSEHERISKDLDDVMARVDEIREAPLDDVADLTSRVRLLIDDVQQHEIKETELLQSAYWREVGVGD